MDTDDFRVERDDGDMVVMMLLLLAVVVDVEPKGVQYRSAM